MSESSIVSQGYDAVYEATPRSPTLWRIWKEQAAGADYPDEFSHISFVGVGDLQELASSLQIQSHSKFADLACGIGVPPFGWRSKLAPTY